MMRVKLLITALLCWGATQVGAQVDTTNIPAPTDSLVVPEDTAWTIGGNFGLQFTQAAYSNWQAGGVNSLAGNGIFNIFADYDNGGVWKWSNRLDLAYGLNYQDTLFNKTDDRIELESRLDREISKNWNASLLTNFRTQFDNGYQNPGERGDSLRISAFMAPGYLVTALGFTYAPNKKLNVFISPITSKMTFVLDQRLANEGAFGVEAGDTVNGVYVEGKQFRQEVGGYFTMVYKNTIAKNVDLQYRLALFSNYLDNQYQFIDVNTELLLFMKVNKYITANVSLNLIYDHDILFDVNDDGVNDGPRTQFKEILGIGLSYNFGDKKEK